MTFLVNITRHSEQSFSYICNNKMDGPEIAVELIGYRIYCGSKTVLFIISQHPLGSSAKDEQVAQNPFQ